MNPKHVIVHAKAGVSRGLLLLIASGLVLSSACSRTGVYYKALEKIGIEKRDVLVSRVTGARDSQKEAQKQFRDALEEFRSLVGYKGGDLEKKYDKLRNAYEDSKKRADDVRNKVKGVRDVANRLFREWQAELQQYTDSGLRRQSEQELAATRLKYGQLIEVMERAASRMDPVLAKLNDQVLFLKHNLNARVLGSLQGTADTLQIDVSKLIQDMESSIAEATSFINQMGKGETK